MWIQAGTYALGPEHGDLHVRTQRTGAAAMAGHNLLLRVSSWQGTLTAGEDPADTSIELTVDGSSLRVLEGKGGMQSLEDEHKAEIEQTIHDDVLKRQTITFRSTHAEALADGRGAAVEGDLTLNGKTRPITFDATVEADGALAATTVIKQTDFGMKPYSTLFGALKVVDEVEISIAVKLPANVASESSTPA